MVWFKQFIAIFSVVLLIVSIPSFAEAVGENVEQIDITQDVSLTQSSESITQELISESVAEEPLITDETELVDSKIIETPETIEETAATLLELVIDEANSEVVEISEESVISDVAIAETNSEITETLTENQETLDNVLINEFVDNKEITEETAQVQTPENGEGVPILPPSNLEWCRIREGENSESSPFVPCGKISGTKYEDTNANGIIDEGETGIEGWTIYIKDADGEWTASVTTDENGNYVFENLKSGSYEIWEDKKTWTQSYPDFETYTISLTPGQQVTDIDFANYHPGRIKGCKFNDMNGNGIWDEEENSISGWTIILSDGVHTWEKITDIHGCYVFGSLKPGTYSVSEIQQDGWEQSYPQGGGYEIFVGSFQSVEQIDFGNHLIDENYCESCGMIKGKVYVDTNGNGVIEHIDYNYPIESGQETLYGMGWRVYLYDENHNIITFRLTNPDSEYAFMNLPSGKYYVSAEPRENWVQTFPSVSEYEITITSADNYYDKVDYSNFKYAVISGCKFSDVNGDGVWNEDENGIPGWSINVVGNSLGEIVNYSTVTDSNGCYEFPYIWYGLYFVSEEQKDGWIQTFPDHPNLNGRYSVPIVSGKVVDWADFGNHHANQESDQGNEINGEEESGNIRGKVYIDTNGNGIIEHIDYGYPIESGQEFLYGMGWKINLYNSDHQLISFRLTNPNSEYAFLNLPAGTYYIKAESMDGWVQTYPEEPVREVIINGNEEQMDFANFKYGIIKGCVFDDYNNNANWENQETLNYRENSIAHWQINMIGNSMGEIVSHSTMTDKNGCYEFPHVWYGYYFISEEQKDGWTQTYPDYPRLNDRYYVIVRSGTEKNSLDFGNYEEIEESQIVETPQESLVTLSNTGAIPIEIYREQRARTHRADQEKDEVSVEEEPAVEETVQTAQTVHVVAEPVNVNPLLKFIVAAGSGKF